MLNARPDDRPPPVRRVGMFGGAFDPPHRAHRGLVESALELLRLDRLHILPTGRAWHKARTLSPAEHRLAMCELAFGDLEPVRVDRREIDRPGDSYTVDTLEELAREYAGSERFLLIGQDQLAAFKTWHRWSEVLDLAQLVVAGRPDVPAVTAPWSGATDAPAPVPHLRLSVPLSPISSTEIRSLVASGADSRALAALVPEAVAGYISNHSLYQQPS
ncbi:nicotinate (nicotinamide) nucleotide adenylyltransferase [Hydrogenophaga pseudoflava]|uniref:nicotinate (nicotinamide) nucleotide adenylyltransferase n=1 Tax=Hydrogenophaga pseudoflava TaxID=47421 RepID=UPI0027E41506|nr:nicotinate (nicotinamide) nucleotide adenylyltransferase [Hydrogenophaga pseudoflava]MDQ7744474.1 nicotinate (nicotinamide) nucleotide adenylyltransferase [Hydrogenophaga pseudoflava]